MKGMRNCSPSPHGTSGFRRVSGEQPRKEKINKWYPINWMDKKNRHSVP